MNELTLTFNIMPLTKDNEKIYNKRGRFFLSKKYKDFEKQIGNLALLRIPAEWRNFKETCSVSIILTFPDYRKRDIFNYPKSLNDALNGILWHDDSQIVSGHITKIVVTGKSGIKMMVQK